MVKFRFALVVGTLVVLLFSSAAMAGADRDAIIHVDDDGPCCVIDP